MYHSHFSHTKLCYSSHEDVVECVCCYIQGDAGGKVRSLGGDSVGHCEEHSPCEHVSNSDCLPR